MKRSFGATIAFCLAAAGAAPAVAQSRVCVEELAGTCLKYADPAPAPAPSAPSVASPAEREEQALNLSAADRRKVQEGLKSAGAYSGAIDGAIGPGSRRAIAQWQRANGEAATGFLTGAQVRKLFAAAARPPAAVGAAPSGGGASAPTASVAPDAARRRAQLLSGERCSFTAFGTPFRVELRSGGLALASYLEGDFDLRWSVDDNQFCLDGDLARSPSCTPLGPPQRSDAAERSSLVTAFGSSCANLQMRRPPGQL